MSGFILYLHDAHQTRQFDDVVSFSGSDDSGSFGIRANHAQLMSVLSKGLASFMQANGDTHYLASPGAVLYFSENKLSLSARQFIVDSDLNRVRQQLERQIDRESEQLLRLKESLQNMEEAMMQRLWEMERTR